MRTWLLLAVSGLALGVFGCQHVADGWRQERETLRHWWRAVDQGAGNGILPPGRVFSAGLRQDLLDSTPWDGTVRGLKEDLRVLWSDFGRDDLPALSDPEI